MVVDLGTNAGFVSSTPSADPAGTAAAWGIMILGQKDTSPAGNNRVTEIGFYQDKSIEVSVDYDVAIYDHDSINDKPDDIIGSSTGNALITSAKAWNVVTGLNISLTASTAYWVVARIDDDPNTLINYSSDSGSREMDGPMGSSLPDPWNNVGDAYDDYSYAMFAKYESVDVGTGINIGDSWKAVDITAMQINIGDTWKAVAGMQVNIGDVWKEIF